MACCKKVNNINIPQSQQRIVDSIKRNQPTPSSVTKSNRAPAGFIARQCPICGAKTISPVCPICNNKI